MAFLKVKRKKALVFEEMLPRWFYHQNELDKIRSREDFAMFIPGGFYRVVYRKDVTC